jgi:hypothetical protein
MKPTLIALAAAATLAAATAASLGAGSVSVTGGIVVDTAANEQPAYVAAPDPGYIVYSGYNAALPGPSCYWTRMPIYGSARDVIGWRGHPVAVCPQPRLSAQAESPRR